MGNPLFFNALRTESFPTPEGPEITTISGACLRILKSIFSFTNGFLTDL
jgi:hypothetical protein